MFKSFLLASLLLFPAYAQTGVEVFPGGMLLYWDSGFFWESEDVSGWIPSNIRREPETYIQTTADNDFPLFIEFRSKDGNYELIPISRDGVRALGKGLKKAGLIE